MEHSQQLGELATALAEAQKQFTAVAKTETNPFFKSKYAGLPQVVEYAAPIITEHGLSISQFLGTSEDGRDTLTTWLLHKSGQFISQTMRLHLTKEDAQGQGSATTYARRYAYMAVLGLVADEDDDGNAASSADTKTKAAYPAKQKTYEATISPKQATELVAVAKRLGASTKEEASTLLNEYTKLSDWTRLPADQFRATFAELQVMAEDEPPAPPYDEAAAFDAIGDMD